MVLLFSSLVSRVLCLRLLSFVVADFAKLRGESSAIARFRAKLMLTWMVILLVHAELSFFFFLLPPALFVGETSSSRYVR